MPNENDFIKFNRHRLILIYAPFGIVRTRAQTFFFRWLAR